MASNYEKIREANIKEYGEGTRHLSFLGRLYTDRTHFIFELLQNAEDAGATKILFELFKDRLEVKHDGRPFTEPDVRGVCGVGEGKKAEDLTQIGKFGIGFKSVYAYTSKPQVHTGDESFRIENYVRPFPVERRSVGDSWTTLFVFAFDADGIDPETACREIGARLRNLSARTLLFLRKIKEIEYRLADETSGVYLREEVFRGPGRQVTVIGQNNGEDEDENWLVFEKAVSVPDRDCSVKVEVGFKLSTGAKDNTERITRTKDAPLVVYFPTEKQTRFGFLIQGPYRTTPSRDNIPKDDKWNATLVEETAVLLIEALLNLKEMGLLTVTLLEALPIRMDDFSEDSMFFSIVSAVRDALMGQELLPADDGTLVAAESAKLARGGELRNLLDQANLGLLFQATKITKWLSADITQDRTPDLRSYVMNELDVEEVTPDGFARKLSLEFLSSQTDEWFIRFYTYLSGQEALWRSPRRAEDAGVLRSKPILRLQDNKQETPFDSDGTANAFLPPPEDSDFPVVKRQIVDNEQAAEFLRRLGLSEPDVFDDIVERVLPKYARQDRSSIAEHEHEMDIQKIMRAMASDSEAGKKKVVRAARQTPFLRAIDQSGNLSFKRPGDVYTNNAELRGYFSSATDVWFLDETSIGISSKFDTWVELGVTRLPRRVQFRVESSDGLPAGERKYSTRAETIENYDLHGLAEFLQSLQNTSNVEEKKVSSRLLWSYLVEHLEANPHFFKGRYHWFHYTAHTKYIDSRMLTRLRESVWIATQDGSLERPTDINVNQLYEEFAGCDELIEILGIEHRDEHESINEYAKTIGFESADEAHKMAKLAKIIRDSGKSPDDLISQFAPTDLECRPNFPNKPSVNPEQRRKRLVNQIKLEPQKEYEVKNRSVRTSRGDIDTESVLRSWYTNDNGQMVCQICKEEMPFKKRNMEYYFEAVEALSGEHFTQENGAQYLALCPLCAARFQEFVKHDEAAMVTLKNALMNSENDEISIQLGDINKSIRFVERHIQDMKTIMNNQK